MSAPTSPISAGRLRAMDPAQRAGIINKLSPDVRMKLAHLATLGAVRAATEAAEYTAISAELTREPQ